MPARALSLRETIAFLESRDLPVDRMVDWLKSRGGYCDCEVLVNVQSEWDEKTGRDAGWEP
ncbi:MAG: DUF2695 domain-containing protein [Planctomycetota bacterium]